MPSFNPFKDAATKAQDEFSRAYSKGVNLGPEKWEEASNLFSSASKHYSEVGDSQRASECLALSSLFFALVHGDAQSWLRCSEGMKVVGSRQVNVGFAANADDIGRQAQVLFDDLVITGPLNSDSRDASKVGILRKVAQEYLELIGSELVIWKLMKAELDPQGRAYYLLGLASLVEANSVMETDPAKGVSLLSESATHFEMAGVDPMNLRAMTKAKRDNASLVAKCWFCGREFQGLGTHFVLLQATISNFTKQKYGTEFPPSLDGQHVNACEGCATSIRTVADNYAKMYYEKALAEMRHIEERLDARMNQLQGEINSLRSRITFTRR